MYNVVVVMWCKLAYCAEITNFENVIIKLKYVIRNNDIMVAIWLMDGDALVSMSIQYWDG